MDAAQRAGVTPAGWYDDGSGRMRWWDGAVWTEHFASPPRARAPMTHGALNVKRDVVYTRPQTRHSLTKHLLFGWIVLYIPTIYYAVSPNHYYTA